MIIGCIVSRIHILMCRFNRWGGHLFWQPLICPICPIGLNTWRQDIAASSPEAPAVLLFVVIKKSSLDILDSCSVSSRWTPSKFISIAKFAYSQVLWYVKQAVRKTAVMEAYLAAQKYCSTVECRRATLLNYFGEGVTSSSCGEYFVI